MFFLHGGDMPSFSAVHDQEYSPRPCGVDAGQKFGRTSAVSQKPGRGGEETGTCEAPEQIFAGMPWHAYRQCGGEALREYLFSRKAMANMKTDLHVRAPAAGQRNSAGASRHYSGMSAVENSALYGGMERSDRSTLLWA